MTDESRRPFSGDTDWKAILLATSLFCGAVLWVGNIYRDHILSLVDERIAAHSKEAATDRVAFFRDLESRAENAVDRIGKIESNCAVVQSTIADIKARLGSIDTLYRDLSKEVTTVTGYVERDERDVRELRETINAIKRGQR